MADIKTFEDKFDHDPNAVREEEPDWDLGPDDEFEEERARRKSYRPKKRKTAEIGCFGGIVGATFRIALSLGMIAAFYHYITHPEEMKDLSKGLESVQNAIAEFTAADQEERKDRTPQSYPIDRPDEMLQTVQSEKPPVLSIERKPLSAVPSSVPLYASAEPARGKQDEIVLYGAGILPDFSTAAKKNPSLNAYRDKAMDMTFETLDTFHALVKDMIAEWAGETDEQKIAEIVQMPYKTFFYKTSAFLLSQTVLPQAGLTPEKSERLIRQSSVQTMALLYPKLREAMAVKTTVQDQIKTIEPVSSFLIYICRDESECMASWDLLIDMLGVKQFSQRLEKAPESIYAEQ